MYSHTQRLLKYDKLNNYMTILGFNSFFNCFNQILILSLEIN